MKRALLSALIVTALVYFALHSVQATPRDSFALYLPSVTRTGYTSDARKGIAGFTFSPNVTSSASYRAMGISGSYNWQTWLTPTWNTSQAYPLPQQPYNDFRSLSDRVWFGMFQLGFTCDNGSQSALAICAGNVVRRQGAMWVLWGNEIDGSDPNFSDALTPTLAAQDWHEVRTTLLAANPNVKFAVGGFLWPNGNYVNQFISEYQRLYGAYPLGASDVWAWHGYSNFGGVCNSPAHAPQDAQCISNAFANVLHGITTTVHSLSPNRNVWLTEWGISGGAETAQSDYAAMLPMMCAQIRATSEIDKFFEFVGSDYAPTPNSWLLQPDGTESVLGHAYESC